MKIYYISQLVELEDFRKVYTLDKKPGQQVQKFNRLIVEGLKQNNEEVICYSSIPASKAIINKTFYKLANKDGYIYPFIINIPLIKDIYTLIVSFFFGLFNINKNDKCLLDIMSVASCLGITLASKLKGYTVTSIITDLPEFVVTNNIFIKLVYLVIKYSDSYVVLTEKMNDKIGNKNKPYVLLDGLCDVKQVIEDNEIAKENVLMYAGSLNRENGIDRLVEAFIELGNKDYILEIYGNGDYDDELVKVANENQNIKFFGVVDNSYIVKRLKEVSLLVNPRPTDQEFTKYSFPSKILEYMSSATPLITTKLDGISSDYDGKLLYFRTSSKDDIKDGLAYCLSHIDEIKIYGIKSQKFALANKNNVVQTKRIISMLKK